MKTIKDLAKEALDVQNACNLSGVVHSFSRAISDLREIAKAEGWLSTDMINQHPICVLFSSKIASLSNSDSFNGFSNSYEWAKKVVNGEESSSFPQHRSDD